MKNKKTIVIIVLAVLLLAFIIATIILASSKSKTDCDKCLACATNNDQTEICCHVKDSSPIYNADTGHYTCG